MRYTYKYNSYMRSIHKKITRFLRLLGPGFITGASDDDPSGIATYTQAGAAFGTGQLWTAAFSFPFMAIVQEMCGRIAVVTGKGIAKLIVEHYSKVFLWLCIILLLIANTINIAADIGAMAQAVQLGFGGVFWVYIVGITAITLALQIYIPYKLYARFLKYLTLSLLAYVAVAFITTSAWSDVLKEAITPHIIFSKEYFLGIVAILGTTISPYLFFWQADQEREEEIEHGTLHVKNNSAPVITPQTIRALRIDTTFGMFISNAIMFFIIASAAGTLHIAGITSIETAADAAAALAPLSGQFASWLFIFGIIGTGLLAIPILSASASYAISEAIGYKTGLYLKFSHARGFYSLIIAITICGALLTILPIAPFRLLYTAAALNGVIAVPLLVMILIIANNRSIMGTYRNGFFSNALGIAITAIMAASVIALLYF